MTDTVYLSDNIEITEQIFGAVIRSSTKRTGYDGILGK